ncbi:hypothetical protein FRB95_012437 [Tulasnella sp. JGI-2019a]|nr:hypothetical protein FRB95_012437 [Tulasnella sp. JGI-2019a]
MPHNQLPSKWMHHKNPPPCSPAEFAGSLWRRGSTPTMDYMQAAGPASETQILPITFSFTFTGTEFNVVGDDWRNGLVTITIDGQPQAQYDLGKANRNSSTSRCMFPLYNQTGLAPTRHTFEFSLTEASPFVPNKDGTQRPGSNAYIGVKLFYFSYTPVTTSTSTTPAVPTVVPTAAPSVSNSPESAHHSMDAASFGAGIGVGVFVSGAIALIVYFFRRSGKRSNAWFDARPDIWTKEMVFPPSHQQSYHLLSLHTEQSFPADPTYYSLQQSTSPHTVPGSVTEQDYMSAHLHAYVPELSASNTYNDGQESTQGSSSLRAIS